MLKVSLLLLTAVSGIVVCEDFFEYHLRNFLNFTESACNNFYRHVCPYNIAEEDTVIFKAVGFYESIARQLHSINNQSPLLDDVRNALTVQNTSNFNADLFKKKTNERCKDSWECYFKTFQFYFFLYDNEMSVVEESLQFYSKVANETRDEQQILHVTATMIEYMSLRGNLSFDISLNFYEGLLKRLAVMDYLNMNTTAAIVGIDRLGRLSRDLVTNIGVKFQQTDWLAEKDRFGLDPFTQFKYLLNNTSFYNDFDDLDRNLTYLHNINRNFTIYYFDAVLQRCGDKFIDTVLAMDYAFLRVRDDMVAAGRSVYFTRIQKTFKLTTVSLFNTALMLAPTFYPLVQLANEQATFASTGYIMAHEIYHTFITSNFTRRSEFFRHETQCIRNHFVEACATFSEKESCDTGESTFNEDTSDLEGLRVAHDLLTRRFNVGQLAELAYVDLPYTIEQTFFYAFAALLCCTADQEMVSERERGFHTPSNIRVNGVLTQIPEFGRAFNCFDTEAMTASDDALCYLYGPNAVDRGANSSLIEERPTMASAPKRTTTTTTRFPITTTDDLDRLIEDLEKGGKR